MERLQQSYFEKYEIQTKAMFLMTLQKNRGENTSAQKLEKLSMPPSPNKMFYICTLLASWAGEGNGTPLQYSCLENPMDGGESDMTERLHFQFSLSTFLHWRRKWQPTLVFLPGESYGRGNLVGCCLWGRTELDTTEAT